MPLIVRRTLLVTLIIFTLVGLPSFYLAHRPDHAAAILHSAADRIASKSKQGGVGGGGSYGGGGDDYHWDKGGLQPEPDHDWEDERPRDSLSLDEEEFVAEVIDYGSHSRRPSAGESISGGSSPKLTNSGISHVSHTEEDEHLEEEDEDEQSSPRDWLNENGKSASRLGSASGSGFGLEKLLSGGDQEDQEINDLDGGVIMPKLGNETAKAELGRATWKFLHTLTLRYPLKPTSSDRSALRSFFHLFARLYPCGDCAAHFQQLLAKYPVQTAGRKEASLWLCSVHNEVNARLGKEEFDCLTLDETYDCGCADEDEEREQGAKEEPPHDREAEEMDD